MRTFKTSFNLIVFLFCLLIPQFMFSQAFETGKSYLGVGYGLGFSWKSYWSAYDTNSDFESSNVGPVTAKFDYGLNEKWSAGLYFAYQKTKGTWSTNYVDFIDPTQSSTYNYEVSVATTAVLGRILYHFQLDNDKLDVYTGGGIGYRSYNIETRSNDEFFDFNASIGGAFGFGLTAGARYELTPLIGIYTEFGLGQVAAIQAGAVVKL